MGARSRFGRITGVTAVALMGLAMTAPVASADFHLMSIREVATNPNGAESSYIELQMYSPGQVNLGGHSITFYTDTGSLLTTLPIPGPNPVVANGDNQRTVLIGDTNVPGRDIAYDTLWDAVQTYGPGGAACFDGVDCVAWGGFTGPLPGGSSPVGTPAPAIPVGSSLERTIAPSCPTLLESTDDTNNSLTDFFVATPSPRGNATTPTETSCGGGGNNPGGGPDTRIDRGPKKKSKKKKATFEFSSTTVGATFECEVDGGKAFTACTSPFTVKVGKGKHTFAVRAVLGGVPDGSPAEKSWTVKKKKKKK